MLSGLALLDQLSNKEVKPSFCYDIAMYKGLQEIIDASTFTVEDGRYIYAKTGTAPPIGDHFLVSKDADEITVVTKEDKLSELDLIDKNKDFYSLIAINVSVPFYSVGLLATISTSLADKDMNVLIASTYSKDYFMVKVDRLQDAKSVLNELGFTEA